jgi:hypothetical protein
MSGTQTVQRERVFGANGETIEDNVVDEPVDEVPEEVVEEAEEEAPAPAATASHKYRIGDKTFATQDEALTYAQSQVVQQEAADAYRQGMRDALSSQPVTESVTQTPQDDFNAEEIYTDPAGFLKKYGERIKSETLQQINQTQASREADDRVWREFTDRHPDLAEFREEIAGLAGKHQPEVHAVARTKGQPAAYDYVATKFKAQVTRQAEALRPKRALPNTSGGGAAGGKVETVTSKKPAEKALSFSEQIRTLRRRR